MIGLWESGIWLYVVKLFNSCAVTFSCSKSSTCKNFPCGKHGLVLLVIDLVQIKGRKVGSVEDCRAVEEGNSLCCRATFKNSAIVE